MTKFYCTVLCIIMFAVGFISLPAAAKQSYGYNDDDVPVIQLQLNFTLFGGYLVDQEQNDLTNKYAEVIKERLNASSSSTYIVEKEDASWAWGVTGEPRLFLGFIGAGLNGFYLWAQDSTSSIQTRYGTETIDVTSTMKSYGICPTIYFRPQFHSSGYVIFGVGMGKFKSSIDITIEDTEKLLSSSDPMLDYFMYEFKGEGTCYRGVIEMGFTPPKSVFFYNIGLSYMQIRSDSYENKFTDKLQFPDKSLFKGGTSNINLYCGVGVCF